MVCIFCHRDEMCQLNGKKMAYRHEKEATSFVCSDCVQNFLQMPQGKLIEGYHLAVERGLTEKASWLVSFIDDETEEFHVSKTGKARPNMVRERPLRAVRPSRHQVRA